MSDDGYKNIVSIVEKATEGGRHQSRHSVPRPDKRPPSASPFEFKRFDKIDPSPRKDWLVRGALGAGEFSALYGDPGSGKSVFATDLAFHIASGADWFGRAVKQGAVIHVAAERAKLTERRLAA